MSKVFKYKMFLILAVILILVLVSGLSLLSFNHRKFVIEDNNPEFCYTFNDLIKSENKTSFKNVQSLYKKELQFKSITLYVDNEEIDAEYTSYNSATAVLVQQSEAEMKSKVEFFYMANTVSPLLSEYIPNIRCSVKDDVLTINIINKFYHAFYPGEAFFPRILIEAL